jgi:hypothetical protein
MGLLVLFSQVGTFLKRLRQENSIDGSFSFY